MVWNVGSVTESVHRRVDDVPSYYSGTEMQNAVRQRLQYMSNAIGTTISDDSISAEYQGIIVDFVVADTKRVKDETEDFKIGEFSTKQGNSAEEADKIEARAEKQLTQINAFNFSRTF